MLKKLLEFFILGVTARSAASLPGIQGSSAILFHQKIRQIINWHLVRESEEMFDGSVELDESYLGGTRKDKRGRGAADKVVVFGIFKRNDKVYTVVIENARAATLMPILDINQFRHKKSNRPVCFAEGKSHINGIENFWGRVKRILRRYHEIDRKFFHCF